MLGSSDSDDAISDTGTVLMTPAQMPEPALYDKLCLVAHLERKPEVLDEQIEQASLAPAAQGDHKPHNSPDQATAHPPVQAYKTEQSIPAFVWRTSHWN